MFNQVSDEKSPTRAGGVWHRTPHARGRSRRLLSIEGLEARALLATMFVDDDWADSVIGDVVAEDKVFGTNAFATIQAAIAGAAAGDEIDVAAGAYTGALSISKPLTIVGAGASETTLNLSGVTSNQAVSITASGVSLAGLLIAGASTA